MMNDDDDPNEAYDVVPLPNEPHGPKGWWRVLQNGVPHVVAATREKCERFAADPTVRAAFRAKNVKAHDRKGKTAP